MGGLPVDKCKSEAFCSIIRLKKASILAIETAIKSHLTLSKYFCHCKQLNQAFMDLMELIDILQQEMKRQGAISFAQFMELALYHPEWGYYEGERNPIGRHGDYYTSVSVGSLFGELLAWQFLWWMDDGWPSSCQRGLPHKPLAGKSDADSGPAVDPSAAALPGPASVPRFHSAVRWIEAGAHDGQLARDVLRTVQRLRPDQFERLEYWIIEPSARRRSWQQRTLGDLTGNVRWLDSWDCVPATGVRGIVFANELLDALPVHRLGWDAGAQEWFEWRIEWRDGAFAWIRWPLEPPLTSPGIFADGDPIRRDLPSDLLSILPDGFTTEVCPSAERWWFEAASRLDCGYLLTLDYGLEQEDFFTPQRAGGTVRAYWKHQGISDLLARPGQQDLTAWVNFTVLKVIGEAAGLATLRHTAQASFFTEIVRRSGASAFALDADHPQRLRQFKTLVHPDHLGQTLKVLVQGRKLPCQ
jgi:SAM-dependent MidA family methyltransferase